MPRAIRRARGVKSSQKVTFIDQVHHQQNNDEDTANKTKKLRFLVSDKDRGIVNVFYVESQKKYNATEPEDVPGSNAICKCQIF